MGILQPLDDTASLLVDLVQRIKDMCIDDFQCTAETGLKLWKKNAGTLFWISHFAYGMFIAQVPKRHMAYSWRIPSTCW